MVHIPIPNTCVSILFGVVVAGVQDHALIPTLPLTCRVTQGNSLPLSPHLGFCICDMHRLDSRPCHHRLLRPTLRSHSWTLLCSAAETLH